MTDRAAAGFRGPVHRVVEERTVGNSLYRIELEFDPDGKSRQPRAPIELPEGQDVFWGGLPGLHGYAFPTRGASRLEIRMSARGMLEEAIFLHSDGSVATRLVTEPDDHTGYVGEVRQFSGDKPLMELTPVELDRIPPEQRQRFAALFEAGGLESRILFSYDTLANLTGVQSYIGDQPVNSCRYEYNPQGDRIRELHESQAEVRYHYEYDSHGNWTRMIVHRQAGDEETHRTIEYHSA